MEDCLFRQMEQGAVLALEEKWLRTEEGSECSQRKAVWQVTAPVMVAVGTRPLYFCLQVRSYALDCAWGFHEACVLQEL